MFTGIITHLGKIKSKTETSFTIEADASLIHKLEEGISIAVNGICLTVLEKPVGTFFTVEVMPETLKRSMLGKLTKNDVVNLELPVTTKAFLSGSPAQGYLEGKEIKKIEVKNRGLATIKKLVGENAIVQKTDRTINNLDLRPETEAFLSGHLVQGHVDGVGMIKKIVPEGNSKLITITVSDNLSKYIVEKGFITINGISLTVIDVTTSDFTVGIIPFTWEHTMLHTVQEGDQVNIEIDILAKYIEKIYAGSNAL